MMVTIVIMIIRTLETMICLSKFPFLIIIWKLVNHAEVAINLEPKSRCFQVKSFHSRLRKLFHFSMKYLKYELNHLGHMDKTTQYTLLYLISERRIYLSVFNSTERKSWQFLHSTHLSSLSCNWFHCLDECLYSGDKSQKQVKNT